MQMEPLSAARSASASSTVAAMMIRDAPFARATAAVVKARKVLSTATAPLAFLAPSKRLWIEIFIAAAASGLFERSGRARLARAFGDIPKQEKLVIIVDGQIHLWEKGTPSAHHRQEPYSAEQAIADMDDAGVDRALVHPVLWDPDSTERWQAWVRKSHDRFAIMGWFYLDDPQGRDIVAHWKERPGMVGLRLHTKDRNPQSWLTDATLDSLC